jgi:hypothetical protein
MWEGQWIDVNPPVRQSQVVDAIHDACALETHTACPWPVAGRYAKHACDGCKRQRGKM